MEIERQMRLTAVAAHQLYYADAIFTAFSLDVGSVDGPLCLFNGSVKAEGPINNLKTHGSEV